MYQSDVNIASSYALHSVCGYGFKNIYTICNAVCEWEKACTKIFKYFPKDCLRCKEPASVLYYLL